MVKEAKVTKASQKFDAKKFQQKLQVLVNERDSIYALSTECFNFKDCANQIVRFWAIAFEMGTMDFRLALVYLANEILHNCKRKDASIYKDEFKKVLPNTLSQLKGTNIVDKVVRVLELWSDRKLLDSAVCGGLISSISSSTGSIEDAKIDHELIKNFSPDSVISALKEFLIMEIDTASKERQLGCILSSDSYTSAAVRQLKDRAHGEAYRHQLDDSCQRLEDLVRDLERLEERREALLTQLEKAHMFFAAQYSDVNVVVTAYKKYGEMVAYMKRKVEERLADSPDAEAAADAPSPRADTADAFGVEVAVLSRREDEMDIDSGGNTPVAGQHHHHQQHSSSKRRHGSSGNRKRRRRSGSGSSNGNFKRESSGGGSGKNSSRKRSSRSSRSRSRSASSGDGGRSSAHHSHHHHQQQHHHHQQRHEMAIGSDSPPSRTSLQQQQQQSSGRSATPTLDERIGSVVTTAGGIAGAVAALTATNSLPNPMLIGGWLSQSHAAAAATPNSPATAAWRPGGPPQPATPTSSALRPPLPPPPLPPPPPFFPAFATVSAASSAQQQPPQLHHSSIMPPPPPSSFGGGADTDERRRLQPQFMQQPQSMFPPYRHPGPVAGQMPQQQQQPPFQQQQMQRPPPMFDAANRWRPVDGGFSQ